MQLSANLGFLWADLSLPDAILAAKKAGFDAVECHWPYDTPAADVAQALAQTGLPMLGLNTRRGNLQAGENGLSALPGREDEAKAAIDEAVAYGAEIGAQAVHVMAGFSRGHEAHGTFVQNLRYAAQVAGAASMTVVIEPLNRHDAPGYFLQTTDQAAAILSEVGGDTAKLMFDCYHVGRNEGDIITRLTALLPMIGHIQFAGVPARGAPDQGEINYAAVIAQIAALGWQRPLGAEYKPGGDTDATLGWMQTLFRQ
ncbi:MAG: hydroxypyruvate isomerase family protein [Roseobacter sp.]